MVYSGDELLYILHPEGTVSHSDGRFTYNYFKSDHTGSTRALLSAVGGSLQTQQTTDYYPFGMAWSLNNLNKNKYLYSGKEIEDATLAGNVLALYDFGARFYNPVLGRWFNMDPKLQLANPYIYCGNNPILYQDPDGQLFLIDDFVFGFIRGLIAGENPFKTGGQAFLNSARIWGGMFQGSFKQILSRFTWELPQTLVGFLGAHGTNMFGTVDKVDYYDGATVVRKRGGTFGALTLGSFMIGDRTIEADPTNTLFQHEYGHYLQSQAFGWLYLPKFGIPSLLDAMRDDNKWDHNYYAVEQDANVRALAYWEKKFPGFADDQKWNFIKNPIAGWDMKRPYNDPVNQQALRHNRIGFSGWDLLSFGNIPNSLIYHIKYSKQNKEDRRVKKWIR